jgi:hypothetical protein
VLSYTRDGRGFVGLGPRGGPYVERALPDGASAAAFADLHRGLATCADGSHWKTLDGGATWAPVAIAARDVGASRPICGATYCMSNLVLWGEPTLVRSVLGDDPFRVVAARPVGEAAPVVQHVPTFDCSWSGGAAEVDRGEGSLVQGDGVTFSWWPIDGDAVLHAHGSVTAANAYYVIGSSSVAVAAHDGGLLIEVPGGAVTTYEAPPASITGRAMHDGSVLVTRTDRSSRLLEIRASGVTGSRAFPSPDCAFFVGRDDVGAGAGVSCAPGDPISFVHLDGTTRSLPALSSGTLAFCPASTAITTELAVYLGATPLGDRNLYVDATLVLDAASSWCLRELRFVPGDADLIGPVAFAPAFVVRSADGQAIPMGGSLAPWQCRPRS